MARVGLLRRKKKLIKTIIYIFYRRRKKYKLPLYPVSRYNVTVCALSYCLSNQGIVARFQAKVRGFFFVVRSGQPHIQWEPGTVFPWVNRPGREAGSLAPYSADVMLMIGAITSVLHTPSWRVRGQF